MTCTDNFIGPKRREGGLPALADASGWYFPIGTEWSRMTTPHMTLVVTTINIPTLLEEYAANFEKYGRLKHTSAIIVGDKKTPHDSVGQLASESARPRFRLSVSRSAGPGTIPGSASRA